MAVTDTMIHIDEPEIDRFARSTRSVLEFRPDPTALLREVERPSRGVRSPEPSAVTPHAAGPRLAALVALVLVGALAWSMVTWVAGPGAGVEPVGAGSTEAAQTVVVVQPGDTLWSIAADIDPGGDIRATVDRLAARNGGAALTVGQRLVVAE